MIKRIEKLQNQLEKHEAALITGGSNRFYLTGFHSSAGLILITCEKAVFLIDFRYYEKAKAVVKTVETVLSENAYKHVLEILKKENIKELLLDTDEVNMDTFVALKAVLEGVEILESNKISNALKELRAIKDSKEIEFIKSAQAITDKAFSYILERIKIGKTENEIALDLEFFARQNGSEGVAFDFIVVSGENSSLPHGVPTDRQLKAGDFITMDFGARWGGYCSDMTRTVALSNVSEEQEKVYNTVLQSQKMALEKIKAGAVCKEVDAVARNFINKDFKGAFGHGLGHSLGIDIHECPSFNTRDNTVLKSGMVLTVEPGIYLENKFGVRIEDTVIVTNEGYENITKSPKELMIL
ncbi:MAG: aminopeptidase P family protein [Clostridia bacterium]|nr:aminopeptidase P family protein [Clostridia bacterium]